MVSVFFRWLLCWIGAVAGDEEVTGISCALRSMAEVGLSARTHQQEGSTPRTLAGSVLENSNVIIHPISWRECAQLNSRHDRLGRRAFFSIICCPV
jgi:hypothetical protein